MDAALFLLQGRCWEVSITAFENLLPYLSHTSSGSLHSLDFELEGGPLADKRHMLCVTLAGPGWGLGCDRGILKLPHPLLILNHHHHPPSPIIGMPSTFPCPSAGANIPAPKTIGQDVVLGSLVGCQKHFTDILWHPALKLHSCSVGLG